MKIKRFFAPSVSEALSQVRESLGPEAIILSNRHVMNGFEILASLEDDLTQVIDESEKPATSLASQPTQTSISNLSASTNPDPVVKNLLEELREMRNFLANRLDDTATNHEQKPHHGNQALIFAELLALGFSASLARYMAANIPADLPADIDTCLQWAKAVLLHNLITVNTEQEMLDQGGIYALVGPTGVGKTTTTAKLAARFVLRHGANQLALINTDSYRIGAPEQVRIYGKILGVSVHAVRDQNELALTLDSLTDKHSILIDTVGMSQRDQMISEQLALLSIANKPIKRLLCLNATSSIDTLNEIVEAYQGSGLAGCILTKLDEAVTISNALEVLLRHKLKLFYLASGQRVPEDLELADAEKLMYQAFEHRHSRSSTRLKDSELSLLMNSNPYPHHVS